MTKLLLQSLALLTRSAYRILSLAVDKKRLDKIVILHWCGRYGSYGLTAPPFIGKINAPTVTTQAATNVQYYSATGNGTISNTGGANATERGICYMVGTSGDPTTANSKVSETGSFSTGAYTENVGSLSANTGYRFRAYAINSAGTGYGTSVQVTTPPDDVNPPSVVLNSPADLGLTTSSTPALSFTGTDPESKDVRYNIQYGTSRVFNSTVLNGTSQAWGITSNANLEPTTYYTMGAWIKHNISSNTGGSIIQMYRQGWGVRLTANYGYLFSWMSDSTGPTRDHGIGGLNFNGDGKWHWAVVTWDGANHSLWLDGVLDNQSAMIYPPKSWGTMYPRIGCGNEIGTNQEFFNGEISNAFFVNGTAWDAATIAANMYKDIRSETNIKGYWQFVNNGNDSSSYGHTLTGIGTPTYATYETGNKTSGTDSGFSGSPDNTDPYASGQQVSYTPQSALSQGTYYWRVRGIDPSGTNTYGKWSNIRSFTCDPSSPPTVALTTGSTGNTAIGSSDYVISNGVATGGVGRKVTYASAVTVVSVAAALRTNDTTNKGVVICKIYSDSSGSRGTLQYTSTGTVVVTDLDYVWTLFTFPTTVSLSAGTYWLQIEGTTVTNSINGIPGANFIAYTSGGYTSGGYTVSSTGSVSYTNDDYSVYAAHINAAGTDTTPTVSFKGTDAQSNDIRYRIQVFNYPPKP